MKKSLQVHNDGVLELDYVPLPIEDLSIRFMWRMVKPFMMAWNQGAVSIIKPMLSGSSLLPRQVLPDVVAEYVLALPDFKKNLMEWENTGEARFVKVVVSKCHITRDRGEPYEAACSFSLKT